ncbi:MAG TPA: cation/H(+) antiporter, partial [Bacteroidales bacterium]|nr:cation/H(+) antiporter [Bacteroidales bacterium]
MKKLKDLIFYLFVIGGFTYLMYWITNMGAKLEIAGEIKIASTDKTVWMQFIETLVYNIKHPLAILLAQIITIIIISRLFGWICKKIGQPTVIGEIAAGIFLGPSLIGMYFPEFSAFLFPAASLGNLQFLSQIGLILFMFIVGMEIDMKLLKTKASDAVVISNASIVIPFALGMGLAYFLYTEFAPKSIPFLAFGLFVGISMSITAFPVLARIMQERGLHKTRLGTVIITAAAVDDISAWSLLAAVIAIVKAGSFASSLYIIILAVAYVLFMLLIVRPFLKRVGELHSSRENLTKPIVAIFILTLILSAWATEIIGIHALFGAFMAGTIMPENPKFRNVFIEKIEDIALVLLLPLFFVYTGLRTEIGLLNEGYLWMITGVIILVAIAGKFLGSAIAAKFIGQSWKDSLTIGALMNTRGLVELVVLNIGYDLGVLTPEIFAMLVIMALVTTFLTGPALDLINWAFKSNITEASIIKNSTNAFNVLISFAKPETGKSLVRLANSFVGKNNATESMTAMHLMQSDSAHRYNIEEYETKCFLPIQEESKSLNREVKIRFQIANDLNSEIIESANNGNYNLLLLGIGQSIFDGSILGKILGLPSRIINPERLINQVTGKEDIFEHSPFDERTRLIIAKSNITVGILIDRGFTGT